MTMAPPASSAAGQALPPRRAERSAASAAGKVAAVPAMAQALGLVLAKMKSANGTLATVL